MGWCLKPMDMMELAKHCKAIGGSAEGAGFVERAIGPALKPPPRPRAGKAKPGAAPRGSDMGSPGVVLEERADAPFTRKLVDAIAQHRHWSRAG